MSGPDDIDALVVARRILAAPRVAKVTHYETLALAGCLVGLDEQLDEIELRPTTNARLASAIADFIRTEDALATGTGADGYVPLPLAAARYEAFKTLKTTFEQEFPHV